MKTFLQLKKSERVTGAELLVTLQEYVSDGAAICADEVIELAHRVPMDANQRIAFLDTAKTGERLLIERKLPRLAADFRKLIQEFCVMVVRDHRHPASTATA